MVASPGLASSRQSPAAEFDDYAHGYSAGMDNPTKRLLGDSADDFIAVKLQWLLREFPILRTADPSFRVLDYGCGSATLLRLMRQAGLRMSLAGCDVSREMLAEAESTWPAGMPAPELRPQVSAAAPFPEAVFDLVIISAVLHHVVPADRPEVYAALHRALRPGGRIVVVEHNPLNPVTRYVVARTPIDRNAILLRAQEARDGLRAAGCSDIRTKYLMFLPPRLHALSILEGALGWLPVGAQYAVTGVRG